MPDPVKQKKHSLQRMPQYTQRIWIWQVCPPKKMKNKTKRAINRDWWIGLLFRFYNTPQHDNISYIFGTSWTVYIYICIIICMKWPCFVNDPWWPNPPFYGWIAPIHGGSTSSPRRLDPQVPFGVFQRRRFGQFRFLGEKGAAEPIQADRIRQGRWLVLEFFFGGMQQFKSHLFPQSKHSTSDDKGFSTT